MGSNLAVIPGVRVALKLGGGVGAAPAMVLGFNGIASAMYHLCDLEVRVAVARYALRESHVVMCRMGRVERR